jgi:hypothetical protein
MMMPPLRAGMTEISLENADRRTGWRPSIIKSAGEPDLDRRDFVESSFGGGYW